MTSGGSFEASSLPMPRDFPVLRSYPTRWADNDSYGHLNNVVYYELFDTAINSWLIEAAGVDVRGLPAIGVVAETSCRFLQQISFPDSVQVGIKLARRGRSSVVYELAIFREQTAGLVVGDVSAVGRFVHVYVDATTRRPVSIPDEVAVALDSLGTPVAG